MTSVSDQTLDFNKRLKVNFEGGDLTSDSGLLLYREFVEKLGLSDLIDANVDLNDPVSHDTHLS